MHIQGDCFNRVMLTALVYQFLVVGHLEWWSIHWLVLTTVGTSLTLIIYFPSLAKNIQISIRVSRKMC